MNERFNRCCWIATFVVLSSGIVGNLVFYKLSSKEDEDASMKLAQLNTKASARARLFSHVDDEGVTQHTLCSSGGWCVTDRVPPEDFSQAASKKRPGAGIPLIDAAEESKGGKPGYGSK